MARPPTKKLEKAGARPYTTKRNAIIWAPYSRGLCSPSFEWNAVRRLQDRWIDSRRYNVGRAIYSRYPNRLPLLVTANTLIIPPCIRTYYRSRALLGGVLPKFHISLHSVILSHSNNTQYSSHRPTPYVSWVMWMARLAN